MLRDHIRSLDVLNFDERHSMGSLFRFFFSMQCFDGERDALATADAERDDAALETVAAH
jgi:hypothetical protein